MIRGVTFDFWQTLADDEPENLAAQRRLRLEALHEALRWSGVDVDALQVESGYERSQELLEERFWNRHRDPGFAEQVALVLDCVAPGASTRVTGSRMDALLRGYADPVLRRPPALCPGAAEAVRTLAGRGVRLGVISNTGRTPGVVLRRFL
jgi:putative hydrolase of the HAD superfamily